MRAVSISGIWMGLPLAMVLTLYVLPAHSQVSSDSGIVAGLVVDTVKCKISPRQSYAVYVPKNYTPSISWPAIFLYDPAARGSLTVSRYKLLAERFQCLLICSNNSRNGPVSLIRMAEEAVWQDATARYSLARDKIFISGFSGGSRSAVDLALRRKVYSGIIACGAAFPAEQYLTPKDSIPFIELIGNEDMNLDEAFEAYQYLKKVNYPCALLPFEGPHAWPPAEVYEQAIFWQMLQHANRHGEALADSLIFNNEKKLSALITQQIDSGDFYLAHLNISQATSQAVKYSSSLETFEKLISSEPRLPLQENEFTKLLVEEAAIKEKFSEYYSILKGCLTDEAFQQTDWKNLFARVGNFVNSKDRLEVMMGRRIRNWMALVGNSEFRNQFQSKDYFHASLLAWVLTLLENDYSSYLKLARAYAERGMKKESLVALKKSAALGLQDKKVVQSDPALSILRDEKSYLEILNKMK